MRMFKHALDEEINNISVCINALKREYNAAAKRGVEDFQSMAGIKALSAYRTLLEGIESLEKLRIREDKDEENKT